MERRGRFFFIYIRSIDISKLEQLKTTSKNRKLSKSGGFKWSINKINILIIRVSRTAKSENLHTFYEQLEKFRKGTKYIKNEFVIKFLFFYIYNHRIQ